jgi:MFS transporter, FHS family, glucose/mannose:H+ symporter
MADSRPARPLAFVPMTLPSPRRLDRAAVLACVALGLVGWGGLLVPSLIRSIERDLGQDDAGIGIFFFIYALASAMGSLLGGLLTERVGRRIVLPTALVLMSIGLIGLAATSIWPIFLLSGVPLGLGSGALDGGTNGLILDMYPTSRGRSLNLLHLCFSIGALGSPLLVGRLLEAGVDWRSIVIATAVVPIPLSIALALAPQPSGRHLAARTVGAARVRLAPVLIALAIAIACYVGAEIGVSNWLVRFLESASVGTATGALALLWAGLTLGRLVSARIGDRFDHARFASAAALAATVALFLAIVVPWLPASIALFGLAGFAFGPVYPLIMAVGGDRYPARSAAVAGFLSGTAIIGAILYPPVMGFLSVSVGLAAAMLGAAILSGLCGLVLALVARGAFSGRVDELPAAVA